ncbi:MAG: glycosyltransferase family 1 protein [Gemmatimonadaceae bacterium]|nr:glycosyltransferase family 1 protein [Gemmatimonadaceae bacterium]
MTSLPLRDVGRRRQGSGDLAYTVPDMSDVRLAIFTETFRPQVNGVARTLDRLVQALEAHGGTARVFTADDPAAVAEPGVTRFPSRAFWAYPQLRLAWPSANATSSALADFKPTLVHLATEFGMGLAGRKAARALGVPIVSSYHTNFTAYAKHYRLGALSRPGWQYLRWFHAAAMGTFCPTQASVDDLQAHGFTRCAVWSRGVDSQRFSPRHRKPVWRARAGAWDDTLLVTYVGRLAAEKGLDVALDAVRLAAEQRPAQIRMLVVGDGPGEADARAMAPDCVHFAGRLEGQPLQEAYAAGDVFLFPSTTDTFGNVMLEAMASGLPVLGADVGPTREVLAQGGGWLVPPGRAAAFAALLVRLIDDRALVQRAREEALVAAATRDWDAVWAKLFTAYRAVQGLR